MKKRTWYVFTVKDIAGGLYSYTEGIWNNHNLAGCARDPRVVTMNACDTKREAEAIAKDWNEAYKKNGTAAEWLKTA